MSPSIFQKFEIDSTVEFPSDHFAVSFVGSGPFRGKTDTDTVDLRIGLISGTGTPQVISFIENGHTDEFEIAIIPNSITGTKNGRDGIAPALDRTFEKRYYRFPGTVPAYPPRDQTTGQPIPQVDSTNTPLPPPPPGVSGIFMASQIAREAATAVGVGLIWGCPDYELMVDFFATGRAIDTITKLIRPFTLLTPFKVDVYSNGTSIIIQPRNPFSAPEFTITLAAARRESVTLRVRKTQIYGEVWLTGATVPLATNAFGVWIEGESFSRTTDEAKNANGQVISRVVTEETKITPTGQTKRKVTDYYAGLSLKYTHRITEENEYTIGAFGIVGPIQPKVLIASTMKKEAFNSRGLWVTTETYERGLSYDHGVETGKQTSETEITKTRVERSNRGSQVGALNVITATMEPKSMKIKTTKDSGYLLVEHITTAYTFSRDKAGVLQPVFKSQDVQRQAGFRAGGPTAQPKKAGSERGEQLRLVRTLSVDPRAIKVVQSVPELDLDGLKALMEQFRQSSGLWEYEAMFVGVNMPWIRRGMYIQITDIESEIPGTMIDIPTMLVTEVVAGYDESSLQPNSMSKIRAFGWRSG